tara:strand:- start:1165 stop:1599 length:435 start_codon:yes stop_codon:yes gene_type:complete
MFCSERSKNRKEFNKHYFEFLNFLKTLIITEEKDKMFKSFYNKNLFLKKANPCFFIQKWYVSISIPYHNEIFNDNINFFLNKENYVEKIKNDEDVISNDVNKLQIERHLQSCIHDFDKLDEERKKYLINSIKKMTYLSILYFKK